MGGIGDQAQAQAMALAQAERQPSPDGLAGALSCALPDPLPAGLLLAYYGDDFTGSTDVMDAFTKAGISTVLLLRTPQADDLARFPGVRCMGVAGQSRGKSPAWMDEHLPPVFAALAALNAPIVQYKVCSTFDSSPEIGSIGHALDLALASVPASARAVWSPMVVGAPQLKRYQVFGQLFAAADGQVHRIDRHPTMSRHPVTPMREADLRLHLAQQTRRPIVSIDLAQLQDAALADSLAQGWAQAAVDGATQVPVVMIDVADASSQQVAGRLIWSNVQAQRQATPQSTVVCAASSGLQYALVAHWRATGALPQAAEQPAAGAVQQIAVVSGSCSPVSAAQIRHARAAGWPTFRLNIAACLADGTRDAEIDRLALAACEAWAQGGSPIVYSAEGPDDPAVLGFSDQARAAGVSKGCAADRVGTVLAEVMRRVLDRCDVRRLVVAGGDSSGAVASHLGIDALTVTAPLVPGAPLCRAWSDQARRDGLQIVLKGGQMGGADFYPQVRDGRVA